MGQGVHFRGCNKTFKAPPGDEDRCSDLYVFTNGHVIVSCHELSEAEMEQVIKTKKVYLTLFSTGMQPVFVGGEAETRDLIQDYGGAWKRD